ncbi:hypothetical protein ACUY1T_15610 [Billgrantia sp. Q4P2]|uniref:hypothetical protein n=1 Tax=Billgrantia sp. Q4P2 TaxID=3463857 RepID=UPI004055C865
MSRSHGFFQSGADLLRLGTCHFIYQLQNGLFVQPGGTLGKQANRTAKTQDEKHGHRDADFRLKGAKRHGVPYSVLLPSKHHPSSFIVSQWRMVEIQRRQAFPLRYTFNIDSTNSG